jgi:L-asparaginase
LTILLVATGGTIASRRQPSGAVAVALSGAELLATVPDLDTTDVDVVDVSHGPSWNLDLPSMQAIADECGRAVRTGRADGVVVTHGTDAVEETMWLTELLHGDATERGPIVFTASMRNAGEVDNDGPSNLRDAFAVARSAAARGCGVLLVVNGELHAAQWVTKTNSQALDTFRSPGHGPVGSVVDGAVMMTQAVERAAGEFTGSTVEPAVAIVKSFGGIDGAIVDWHLDRGVRGLVLEGTGAGNVSGTLVPGVERALAAGVAVMVVTRCLEGGISPTYGGPGGGHTLAAMGVLDGGTLNAAKARIALAVLLGRS